VASGAAGLGYGNYHGHPDLAAGSKYAAPSKLGGSSNCGREATLPVKVLASRWLTATSLGASARQSATGTT
jgi:hypothetical protein